MTIKTLKTIDGMQVDWSLDGERFAFADVDTSATRPDVLCTMNVDGSDLHRVIHWTLDPKWSPDGKHVACLFVGSLALVDPAQDYLVDDRKLNKLHRSSHNFAWAPDGKVIAFAEDKDLYLIEPTGSNIRHLVKEDSDIWSISWAPDGCWIAYRCRGIKAIKVDDLQQQTISPYGRSPSWNPAANRIAFYVSGPIFSTDPQVPGGIRIFDFDSGKVEIIETGKDEIPHHSRNALAWSPDGRQLAFSLQKRSLFRKQPPAVYTLEVSTKRFTQQVEGTHANDSAIKWSPDGSKIAVYLMEDLFTRILDVK